MQLPQDVRNILEELSKDVSTADLTQAAQEISDAYRERRFCAPVMQSQAHRLAYLNVRMPATYATNSHVLKELASRVGEDGIRTILDLGAGPGTASLAAARYMHLDQITCLERDDELRSFGARFLPNATWLAADMASASLPRADLVLLSYSLGELRDQASVVARAWTATKVALAVIEPGTPAGFRTVLEARSQLIAAGATIAAPCPHHNRCGLALRNDWCHFSARLERTAVHRRMKGADLGHEDEKFSYFIATKETASHANARVVRHPMKHSGHVQLTLCVPPENIENTTITRSQKGLYKSARKAGWGDAWPPDSLHPPE